MLKGGREKTSSEKTSLTINSSPGQYTPDFTALLKEYYLYL
jgi:hypothetical protein